MEESNTPIVHTSGSVGLDVFKNKIDNFGVFYPLQSFNKDIEMELENVPICIEAISSFAHSLIEI